jgi:hypothetical protein
MPCLGTWRWSTVPGQGPLYIHRHTLVQNGQGRSSALAIEPSQSKQYAPVAQPRALSRLPPNRPRPRLAQSQPPAKAMAAQRSTPPGTLNHPSPHPPHLSSSACDEDRRARGYTQSCSSILLSTILPASVPFTCTSSILPFPPTLYGTLETRQLSFAID